MDGYCIKCHTEREIANPKRIIARDRKRWVKGDCPSCGTAVWKRLPPKEDDLELLVVYPLP